MKNLLLAGLLLLFVSASVAALTKDDFFTRLIDSQADLTSGRATFDLKNPLGISLTVDANILMAYRRVGNFNFDRYELYELKNVTTNRNVTDYTAIHGVGIYPNLTTYAQTNWTVSGWHIESKTVLREIPITSLSFAAGETKTIRIKFYYPAKLGSRSLDWVPALRHSGNFYNQTDWAWFNTSWLLKAAANFSNATQHGVPAYWSINTSQMINNPSGAQMRTDCQDLRFVNFTEVSATPFEILQNCNSNVSNTTGWVQRNASVGNWFYTNYALASLTGNSSQNTFFPYTMVLHPMNNDGATAYCSVGCGQSSFGGTANISSTAVTNVVGLFGNATNFTGGGGFVNVSASNGAQTWGADSWSVSVWVRATSFGGTRNTILANGDSCSLVSSYYWDYAAGNFRMHIYDNANAEQVTLQTGSTASTGVWYHLALTKSSTNYTMFVNGIQNASAAPAAFVQKISTNNVFTIGSLDNSTTCLGSHKWLGEIQELRVINGTAQAEAWWKAEFDSSPLNIGALQTNADTTKPTCSWASLTPSVYQPAFPTWLNATCTDDTSIANVTLSFDGVNYTPTNGSGSVYFRLLNGVSAGVHYWQTYASDAAGNANTSGNFTFTPARAVLNASVYTNASSVNRTSLARVFNFTATKNASEGTLELLYNNTGVNMLLNSSASNTTGIMWLQNNASGYLLSARYNQTQNYSAAAQGMEITKLADTAAPTFSANTSLTPAVFQDNYQTWFNITWTDNNLVSAVNISIDGSNLTPLNLGSVYFLRLNGLAAGIHYWQSYAIDEDNNFNATGNTTFTIARAPNNASVFVNGSPVNSSLDAPTVLNITATKNATEGTIELLYNNTGANMRLNSSATNTTTFQWIQNRNATGFLFNARFNQTQNYSASGNGVQTSLVPILLIANLTANWTSVQRPFFYGYMYANLTKANLTNVAACSVTPTGYNCWEAGDATQTHLSSYQFTENISLRNGAGGGAAHPNPYVRWFFNNSGNYTVNGSFWCNGSCNGDGINWTVQLNGSGSQCTGNVTKLSEVVYGCTLPTQVSQGSYIDFLVGSNNDSFNDNANFTFYIWGKENARVNYFSIVAYDELTILNITFNATITNGTNSTSLTNVVNSSNYTKDFPTGALTITISSGTYATRTYYANNNLSANTDYLISAYLLPTANQSEVDFTVQDFAGFRQVGLIVDVQKFYPTLGGFVTVGQTLTDYIGKGIVYLTAQNAPRYQYIIRNSSLAQIAIKTPAFLTSDLLVATGVYGVTITIDAQNVPLYAQQAATTGVCDFNNSTARLTCTIQDATNTTTQTVLLVRNYTGYNTTGYSTLCNVNIPNGSGALICNIAGWNGSYMKYELTAFSTDGGSQLVTSGTLDFLTRAIEGWGYVGFLVVLFSALIMFAVGSWNPSVALLLTGVALVGTWMIGAFDVGLGSLIGALLIIALLIWKMRS